MPQIPIIMPQLGESIAEATVISVLVKVGDRIAADQDVIEVETNKATMNVTSPCPGRIHKLLVNLNESYPVGAVLGYLEASSEDAERLGLSPRAPDDTAETATADSNGIKCAEVTRQHGVEPTVEGSRFRPTLRARATCLPE